jgi:hypothetical protein
MIVSLDGFYAVYLTGSASQGFAMFVFQSGVIVGVDVGGLKYDGTYKTTDNGFSIILTFSVPPNSTLIQGVTTGLETEKSELAFLLPIDFLAQPFIRIETPQGPVNAKLTKLRELHE